MKRRAVVVVAAVTVATVAAALLAPLPFDDATRIVDHVQIERSAAVVYGYATTPGNWPAWHPSSLGVTGSTDHSLQVGEQVVERYRVAGREGFVRWTVSERHADAPTLVWQIAGDIDGKPAAVITYRIESDGGASRFTRELAYRAPNLLFSLINRLSLRERVQAESTQAVNQLKLAIEGVPERAMAAGR